MGCWNNTCSLSGLPIREYDKVNFVIIANRPSMPTASGFCYSDGYAIPVSFVMTGEYDDYGGVKEVEDDLASKLFLKWFSEGVKDGSLTVVDDDYYKLNTDATIEQILTVFERDLVTYNTELYSKDISVNVGINMWHKSIFDKSTTPSKSINLDKIFEPREVYFSDKIMEEFRKESDRIGLTAMKEKYSEELSYNMRLSLNDKTEGFKCIPELPTSDKLEELLERYLNGSFNKYNCWREQVEFDLFDNSNYVETNAFNGHLKTLIGMSFDKEECADMIHTLEKVVHLKSMLRQSWQAHGGKGSQSEFYEEYSTLVEGMKEIIDNQIEEESSWDD